MSNSSTGKKNVKAPSKNPIIRLLVSPAAWVFFGTLFASIYIGINVAPTWTTERVALDVQREADGRAFYTVKKDKFYISNLTPVAEAQLTKEHIAKLNQEKTPPAIEEEVTYDTKLINGVEQTVYTQTKAKKHWKLFSLMPAIVAICLCWMTKQPLAALTSGAISGAMILRWYDLSEQVFLPTMMSANAAGVLMLYLWLLGGLMGIWSRTGATKAFTELVNKHFVRGPKTAKLVAWAVGALYFQGGSINCVLTGTTVKAVGDANRVSHEELACIVNSNATSIATLLPLNAWPGYVQAFTYVAGATFLATEAQRISFFFKCIPLYFFSIMQVIFTFLLAVELHPFVGKKMKAAMKRARETGQLDAPGSTPMSSKELHTTYIPAGYKTHIIDFFLPLGVLIAIAVYTLITLGYPQIRWAFGAAVIVALGLAYFRGMELSVLMEGLVDGFKGVILGSVILLLAVTIGRVSQELGGGIYIVELLGATIPYWLLPILLVFLTLFIAFSTGTSWGTYAVTFPLAMPLAWAVANAGVVQHPMLFMMICFACVINGSIWGDQCSPISDCCVLSAMSTGGDLMDHSITQTVQSIFSMVVALIAWTAVTLIFV